MQSGLTEAVPFAASQPSGASVVSSSELMEGRAAAWLVTRWQGLGSFLGALRAEVHLGAGTFDDCDNLVY